MTMSVRVVLKSMEQAQRFCAKVFALDYNFAYLAEVKPYKPPKTNPQLAYVHSMISAIAKHTGELPDKIKEDVKIEFGIFEIKTSAITGQRTSRLKSFADYNKSEMEVLLRQVEHYCEENQVEYVRSDEDKNTHSRRKTLYGRYV